MAKTAHGAPRTLPSWYHCCCSWPVRDKAQKKKKKKKPALKLTTALKAQSARAEAQPSSRSCWSHWS